MILVTGGGGFIGSHIARALLAAGEQVRILDDFSSGRRTNLANLDGEIELVEGDLRDADAVASAVTGCDLVFHEGAVPSVPRSVADPRTSIAVGVTGTLNVLLAARDAGVRRVVFASSSSVYGDTPEMPKHEEMKPRPLSPYAISKLSAEQLCGVFTRLYGLETVALRYFNVFGPNQDPASAYAAVIPKFIAAVRAGDRPTIFGDGEQTRDFTYIDNVVDANLRASRAPDAAGKVFNIASGRAISVNRMLELVGEYLGLPAEADYADPRPGDIKHSLADIEAARSVLGYEPTITFEEGLRRTVADSVEATEVASRD
jgi:UDP-glucose 4-epimerase